MLRAILIVALLAPTASHALYRCKDEKGVTHIGETPPAECASVPLQEISRSGTVLRTLEPTPTPEQLKKRQAEEAKAKEAAKAAQEAKRRDQILQASYTSPEDVDRAREKATTALDKIIEGNATRVKAIEKREKEIADELEFYKAGKSKAPGKSREPPAQLSTDLVILKKEKETLVESTARAEKDKADIRARFDADKARWVELQSARR